MTLSTAHGSAWVVADGAAAAIAPVELKIIDPAINAPITARCRVPAIILLLAQRDLAPADA